MDRHSLSNKIIINMKYLKLFENFDYDKIDASEEDYLYTQPSQIPNAGSGLFTSIDIENGEIIAKFIGENSIITMDDEDNVVLVANRDIQSGEEIFVGYGKKYWIKNSYRVS